MTLDRVSALDATLTAAGVRHRIEVYDADHGFFDDTREDAYDAEAARLAWERTIAFLRTELAG